MPAADAVRELAVTARSLRQQPGFSAAVVAVIALSVGVPTAVFTLSYELMIRPVAGVRSDRLVNVVTAGLGAGLPAALILATLARGFLPGARPGIRSRSARPPACSSPGRQPSGPDAAWPPPMPWRRSDRNDRQPDGLVM